MTPRALARPLSVLTLALCTGGLQAQSYQSSFSAAAFDRAKTPASFTGGVAVDAPTGAASVNLPLGPGIGRGALHFVPTLSARFSPNVQASVHPIGLYNMPPFIEGDFDSRQCEAEVKAANFATGEMTTVTAGGASLSPGYFDLLCSNLGGGRFVSNYLTPDGVTGSLAGTVPGTPNISNILSGFGYNVGDTQLSQVAGRASDTTRPTFVKIGSNDELVLGLVDPTFPVVTVNDLHDTNNPVAWELPGRILVVRGDIAFEYTYVNPVYNTQYVPLPRTHNAPTGRSFETLRYGHYLINRVLNRFGESLVFDHYQGTPSRCNGVDYTVTWKSGFTTLESLSVKVLSTVETPTSPVSVLLDPGLSGIPIAKTTIEVSYPGTAQGSYQVEAYPAGGGTAGLRRPDLYPADAWFTYQDGPWDSFRMNLQPVKVLEVGTGATVTFRYGAGPVINYVDPLTGASASHTPTVLAGVDFPGRTVDLTWNTYFWRENLYKSDYGGFIPAGPLGRPSTFAGVSRIKDRDTTTNVLRETLHIRVVPVPEFNGWGWASTTFYDAIKHPDGSTTVHYFTEPLAQPAGGAVGDDPLKPDEQIQTLGFLKHSIRETRHYPIGADWQSDITVPATASSAHTVELYDRWDLRRAGNATGSVLAGSVPYPTRTRAWSKDTGAWTWQERNIWDVTHGGWKADTARTYSNGPVLATAWRSLAAASTPTTPTDAPASEPLFDRSVTRVLNSDFSNWFLGRTTEEVAAGKPKVTTAFMARNLVQSVSVGPDATKVTTVFTYTGLLPKTVTVSGTAGTGIVGIDEYRYDNHGFMTYIRQKGVTWSASQTNDDFGRPTTQTDPNGRTTSIVRDAVGRLTALNPQFGDTPTTIQYDADQRGFTVTRGEEKSSQRYNGFGELVLASRWNGSAWSHKRFEYDAAGRKLKETVWLPGQGSETESTSGVNATTFSYDTRGRLNGTVDPNGVATTITYAGLSRTSTVAPGTPDAKATTFTSDALGRLVEVKDALNQVTKYKYDDPADRILEVKQTDPATGVEQIRSWGYNGLGWLTSLVQPESGTTTYANFHITGKPGTTTSAGLPVTTTYDALGRPLSVSGSGLNQTFAYDQSGHGYANGKLTSSSDTAVKLDWTYGDPAGRLSRLATSIQRSGGSSGYYPDYVQIYTYDSYGRRISATVDGRQFQTTFDDATGLPQAVRYSGAGLLNQTLGSVTQVDPASWMPKSISYAFTGASTLLDYRPDQTSLWTQAHYVDGNPSPLRQWIYTYDNAGRLKGDGEDSYTYDLLDRLSTATVKRRDGSTLTQAFTYDAFGNQASSLTSPVPQDLQGLINNFTFSAADRNTPEAKRNQIPPMASGVPTGAQYDPQGNLTRIYAQATSSAAQEVVLTYDALGRVVSLSRPGGVVEYYAYTPDGLRSRIEIWENNVLKTVKHRIYNDQRQLVSEYEGQFAP
jgi:YD repeat-containing protein